MKRIDWVKICEPHGVKVISQNQTKHIKLVLEAADGRRMIHTASVSPSCHRAMLNNVARIKRFAAGNK